LIHDPARGAQGAGGKRLATPSPMCQFEALSRSGKNDGVLAHDVPGSDGLRFDLVAACPGRGQDFQ
jgi:hypothetical protein